MEYYECTINSEIQKKIEEKYKFIARCVNENMLLTVR